MSFLAGFVVGLFVGAAIGVLVLSMLVIGKQADCRMFGRDYEEHA